MDVKDEILEAALDDAGQRKEKSEKEPSISQEV